MARSINLRLTSPVCRGDRSGSLNAVSPNAINIFIAMCFAIAIIIRCVSGAVQEYTTSMNRTEHMTKCHMGGQGNSIVPPHGFPAGQECDKNDDPFRHKDHGSRKSRFEKIRVICTRASRLELPNAEKRYERSAVRTLTITMIIFGFTYTWTMLSAAYGIYVQATETPLVDNVFLNMHPP